MYDMNTRATCSCFISCISFSNALPWMVLVAYIGWTLKKYITLFISYILYIFYLSCQSYLRFVAWKQVTGNYFTSQGVFIYPQAVALRIASPPVQICNPSNLSVRAFGTLPGAAIILCNSLPYLPVTSFYLAEGFGMVPVFTFSFVFSAWSSGRLISMNWQNIFPLFIIIRSFLLGWLVGVAWLDLNIAEYLAVLYIHWRL